MQIKAATVQDVDSIAKLYVEQFCAMKELMPDFFQEGEQSKEFILSMIQGNNSEILVLFDDIAIVGFALLQEKETPDFSFCIKHKYAYLMDIIITSDARGKGMGSALVDEAKKWASDRKLEYIELDVLSNNNNAINLYKKLGFTDRKKLMFCRL